MSVTYIDRIANDIRSSLPDEVDVPEESDHLFRLYALLALAKGEQVTNRDVHDAWTVWMASKGEEHQSMVPFEDLDPATRDEDAPFAVAIREVAPASVPD